jgi:hypothetical protein
MEAFIKPFAAEYFWLQSTPGPKSQKSYKMQNLVLETMLVAEAFKISQTKCIKRGLLKELGVFCFLLYEMSQGPIDSSPPLV